MNFAPTLGIVAGLGASLISMLAMGQTATDAAGPQLQEIVVTGTHIRRTDAETPSPVQVDNFRTNVEQQVSDPLAVFLRINARRNHVCVFSILPKGSGFGRALESR
jgi:hypothetical protein